MEFYVEIKEHILNGCVWSHSCYEQEAKPEKRRFTTSDNFVPAAVRIHNEQFLLSWLELCLSVMLKDEFVHFSCLFKMNLFVISLCICSHNKMVVLHFTLS